ncbi:hypothetical protein EIP86_004939 [Pleurotus ostreatoroseus]|nr:hypothetical protein EIP86_004939 [Pleurotus ostreatoroseus]
MTGIRAVGTRSKSKAPAARKENQSVRRQKRSRAVFSEDEDGEDEDDDDELGMLSKKELILRLQEAQQSSSTNTRASLSPEEQAEMDDDPFADADGNDDDDDRDVHNLPRRNRHPLEPIEEEEEDEDTEDVRPSKRARNDPKFSTSDAVPVASNISQARRKPVTGAAQPSTTSESTVPTQQRAMATSTPSAGHTTTDKTHDTRETPYTPFKIVPSGKKAREADASPCTKSLLKHSNLNYRVSLAVEEAWPNEADTHNGVKRSFQKACNDSGADRRMVRYNKDPVYAKYIGQVGEQRRSQLRGEVKTKAQALVETFYELKGSCVEIAERVKGLINRKSFTFAIPATRSGMYGHPIFEHIIARQWFAQADDEGCGLYSSQFNPMPLPVIALVATAVHCALMDWESGKYQSKRNKFEYDVYEPIYREHITSLNMWREKNPARCAARQQLLWTKVWQRSGRDPTLHGPKHDDFDDDDYNRASDNE